MPWSHGFDGLAFPLIHGASPSPPLAAALLLDGSSAALPIPRHAALALTLTALSLATAALDVPLVTTPGISTAIAVFVTALMPA